jgi:hypothetical protein
VVIDAQRKALGQQVAYLLEFFRIGRDGRRAKVHQERARAYAVAMMKFTTFSGLVADSATIGDQRGSFLCEVIRPYR